MVEVKQRKCGGGSGGGGGKTTEMWWCWWWLENSGNVVMVVWGGGGGGKIVVFGRKSYVHVFFIKYARFARHESVNLTQDNKLSAMDSDGGRK